MPRLLACPHHYDLDHPAAARRVTDEAARIILLVARLRVAAADMLDRRRQATVDSTGQREAVRPRTGYLELGRRG